MICYCETCGDKCVEEWTGWFSSETGNKVYRMICSNNPCEHSGHVERIIRGQWYVLWMSLLKCQRCGRERALD